MVAAYHLIWTAYGYWLPNDPRGSSSSEIRAEKFNPLGPLHQGRKENQPPSSDIRNFYVAAEDLLEHRRIPFTPDEFTTIATIIGQTLHDGGDICYACAVMPDHVHMVIRRHVAKA